MSGVKAAGLDYGRMRLWGSLSFIAASLVGGWVVERLGAGSAIWLVVAGAALTTAAAHALARPIGLGRLKAATSPPQAFARRGRRPAALAHVPDLPGGRRPGAGRARRVLHLRHAALARPRPLDGLVRRAVGDLDRRRGGAVCLFRRGGAAHRSGGADRARRRCRGGSLARHGLRSAAGAAGAAAAPARADLRRNPRRGHALHRPGRAAKRRPGRRRRSTPPSPAASPWAAPCCSPARSMRRTPAGPIGRWRRSRRSG